jgi:hypothetical protein
MPTPLDDCPICGGLRPAAHACPHCEAPAERPRAPRLARTIAALVGAGAATITLMACYGAPPGYYRPQAEPCTDADHDTVCAPTDCNDQDPTVFPGAADADGDGIDQNCDGVDGWADPAAVAAPAPPDASVAPAPIAAPTP